MHRTSDNAHSAFEPFELDNEFADSFSEQAFYATWEHREYGSTWDEVQAETQVMGQDTLMAAISQLGSELDWDDDEDEATQTWNPGRRLSALRTGPQRAVRADDLPPSAAAPRARSHSAEHATPREPDPEYEQLESAAFFELPRLRPARREPSHSVRVPLQRGERAPVTLPPRRPSPGNDAAAAHAAMLRARHAAAHQPVAFEPEPAPEIDDAVPPTSMPPATAGSSGWVAPVQVEAPAQGRPTPGPRIAVELPELEGAPARKYDAEWIVGALGALGLFVAVLAARVLLAGPLTTSVSIETLPADAAVRVDGKAPSDTTSPFNVAKLAPGSHELLVSKPGFVAQRLIFKLDEGSAVRLPLVHLQAEPQETGFSVSSNPSGARIWVDGEATGLSTPARVIQKSPGAHSLVLEYDGYLATEHSITLPERGILELPAIDLQALPTPAPRKARSWGYKISDGSAREGRVGGLDGAGAGASRGEIRADEPAKLRLICRPLAKIFIDDRYAGDTPQFALRVAPGTHQIRLVNEELGQSRSFSINLSPGERATRVESLGD